MTTIACKDGIIACESRVTSDGLIVDNDCNKGVKRNGKIWFFAGREADEDLLVRAVEGGPARKYGKFVECFAVIVDGARITTASIDGYEGYTKHTESGKIPFAIGSGSSYALGAMAHGATAEEAVEIAKTLDIYSGGKVRTFKIKKRK